MLITLWISDGSIETINLPYKSIDKVRKFVYNNDNVYNYSISYINGERK